MRFELIVMGASLGGLKAMEVILAGLPAALPLPIVAVLHRDARSDVDLGAYLQGFCSLAVGEAEDKDNIQVGRVYLAPADYHLLVERSGALALSTDAPVANARPSVDVLFESAADAYGDRLIGVVLTGASRDGARGSGRIKALGGTVLVQDPATAESGLMPGAAVAAAAPDRVLPLAQIAPALVELSLADKRSGGVGRG